MNTWMEKVVRPSGRLYRARKAPVAIAFDDPEREVGVVVIRTHDVDVATSLAAQAWLVGPAASPGVSSATPTC